MPRPIVALIDIAAMQHNLTVAKTQVPTAKTWAVLKANAYGHGLERGMRGFAQADGLALIEIEAAVRLRELGWNKPILLLEGFFDSADLAVINAYQLEFAVHCNQQIALLERAQFDAPLQVHLKMNSGMNRLGFQPNIFRDAYARLRAMPAVGKITLMTHLANADDAKNTTFPLVEQVRRFNAAVQGLEAEINLSNSAADLLHPEIQTDWVRPGIMLYGATPGGKSAAEFGLLPAMTLKSEIIGIQDIAAGDAVGYGSRFCAAGSMKIGVVACGYADGYPRHAPNGTPIIVDGVKTRIVGSVSMDMITVDLTEVPGAHIGSSVTLWGQGLPIDEVAQAAGTIGYELMCALAARVRIVECS
ncbi:MAG: alanine racemase [Glaciimonas sp.]|nr:alanine racemase [Glaciimonas sp.]